MKPDLYKVVLNNYEIKNNYTKVKYIDFWQGKQCYTDI